MISKKIRIINKLGLHARAAAKLVTMSCSFDSNITLKLNNREANGKSIMSVMMLAACKNSELEVFIDGPDEKEAMSALEFLISHRFDESE